MGAIVVVVLAYFILSKMLDGIKESKGVHLKQSERELKEDEYFRQQAQLKKRADDRRAYVARQRRGRALFIVNVETKQAVGYLHKEQVMKLGATPIKLPCRLDVCYMAIPDEELIGPTLNIDVTDVDGNKIRINRAYQEITWLATYQKGKDVGNDKYAMRIG